MSRNRKSPAVSASGWRALTLVPLLALVLAVVASSGSAAASEMFTIVVNKANPADSLTKAELAEIFLKRVDNWPHGEKLQPVDQSEQSIVRLAFTKEVHNKSVGAIKSYWLTQVYSGRGAPPIAKSSDDAVLAYVAANPGAIGYVAAGNTGPGVKALEVVE